MGRGDGGTCPVSPASGDARFPLQAGNGILSVRRDNSAAPQRRDDLRLALEAALRERKPFAQISRETGIPRSTVKREVLGRRVESTKTFYGRRFNPCARRDGCDAAGMCGRPGCARSCANCGLRCREGLCPRFEEERCPRLDAPPYVCNGCPDEPRCRLRKFYASSEVCEKAS